LRIEGKYLLDKPGRKFPGELSREFREVYDQYIMPPKDIVRLEDVILSDENRKKLDAFVLELQHADELRKHGLEPMSRILSYGATGTGKTLSAKALAAELDYTMLMVDISQALAQGMAADSISKVFRLAAELKYCLIFFDEVDAIAWNRDAAAGAGDGGDIRRATNSLFQYMDQMDETNLFIACTNMLPRLDAAFERRFDLKLEFNRPELHIRDAVQRFITGDFRLVDDSNAVMESIVQKRMRLSYYEIEGISKRAMKRAILANTTEVSLAGIYQDFKVALRIKDRFNIDDVGDPSGTMMR
jgi:SpoVK/Ycf46/Vps4 family AAA+-type ATPase